ncbi:LOW QUALITY PROTEIN: conserved hypothetical protein, partial [Streptomyces sp. SPB78]
GPTPHARGAEARCPLLDALGGSIPTRAGSSSLRPPPRKAAQAHPRTRGEQYARAAALGACSGPSPHARGAAAMRASTSGLGGSIPARAGSRRPARRPGGCRGPSPHARGAEAGALHPGPRPGSIPARAGSSRSCRRRCSRRGVHPRTRGEQQLALPEDPAAWGPSPHARGAVVGRAQTGEARGSIPARAGSSRRLRAYWPAPGVHPRTRGEQVGDAEDVVAARGPSPHARGAVDDHPSHEGGVGSIPARAGSGTCSGCWAQRRGVHPRTRGERWTWREMLPRPSGPSPHAGSGPDH